MASGDCDQEHCLEWMLVSRSMKPPLCLLLAGVEEAAPQAENKGTIYYFQLTFLWLCPGHGAVPMFCTMWL